MRRLILAGVCVAAFSNTARADVPVIDPSSILVEAKQLLQEAKTYIVQAQQYENQVKQLATAVEQYDAFVHDPSLGAAMGMMNTAGLSNSLPVNPLQVQNLTNGYNSLNSLSGILGRLSQLNGLVGTNYATNHVYSPTDGSWNSQQLIANGNAIAGGQGAAQSAYEDLRDHLPILQALRDRLATATTPKDVEDAQAAIQSETAWTSNLQSEVSAIQVNYQAQSDSRVQRDNEGLDSSIDDFLTQANAAGRGLNP